MSQYNNRLTFSSLFFTWSDGTRLKTSHIYLFLVVIVKCFLPLEIFKTNGTSLI